MKVLHISNWYPNEDNPLEAIFIKRQILALNEFCENELNHIQVRSGRRLFEFKKTIISPFEISYLIKTRINIWILKEILTFILVVGLLFSKRSTKTYDVLNFHIAYPLCLRLSVIRLFIKKPIFISEHWTAYSNFFNLSPQSHKLAGIKKIFFNEMNLITVSEALKQDIIEFSGNAFLKCEVIPNIIDTEVFTYNPSLPNEVTFFIMNNWSNNKNPRIPIEAFNQFSKDSGVKCKLKIGGYGLQWEGILRLVDELELRESVILLGRLNEIEISRHLNSSHAFIQCSNYETFSVVCAEAVCCGCPVIVNKLPALEEYLDSMNSIIVDELNVAAFVDAYNQILTKKSNRKEISCRARFRFNSENVARKYFDLLSKNRSLTGSGQKNS